MVVDARASLHCRSILPVEIAGCGCAGSLIDGIGKSPYETTSQTRNGGNCRQREKSEEMKAKLMVAVRRVGEGRDAMLFPGVIGRRRAFIDAIVAVHKHLALMDELLCRRQYRLSKFGTITAISAHVSDRVMPALDRRRWGLFHRIHVKQRPFALPRKAPA